MTRDADELSPVALPGLDVEDVSPFARWANTVTSRMTDRLGSVSAIVIAVAVIVVWALTGPLMGFSNTWQLIINTLTTLVTFTMVFIIQNTQNRDGRAVQTKLDAQSEALIALCRKHGLDPIADRLSCLTGVEEQPEKVIEEEQQEIRRAGRPDPAIKDVMLLRQRFASRSADMLSVSRLNRRDT